MVPEPESERYYSIHLSRWPVGLLWKYLWRNAPLLAWLLFPILFLQRLPGLKPSPQFANQYPHELTKIDSDRIPLHARTAIEARVRYAEAIGFRVCGHYQSRSLGTYEQYDTLLLSPSGVEVIQVRWHRLQVNRHVEQDCRIHCFSALVNGGVLSSNAISEKKAPREYRMTDDQSRFYPETATVEELLSYHREAVGTHPDLRRFDCETVEQFLLERSRRVVDTLLDRRVYFEPTDQEIQNLKSGKIEWSA